MDENQFHEYVEESFEQNESLLYQPPTEPENAYDQRAKQRSEKPFVYRKHERGRGRGHAGRGRGYAGRGRGRGQGYAGRGDGDRKPREGYQAGRRFMNMFKRRLYEPHIKPGHSVLDLACGLGADLDKYAHLGVRSLIMVDVSEHSLQEAKVRAKKSPKVRENITDIKYLQCDLRNNVLTIQNPQVDIVSCQLALHYFWGRDAHVDTVLKTVSTSLKDGGYFLLTILDATRIPPAGIHKHPYVRQSKIYQVDNKEKVRDAYRWSYANLVTNVEEFVIPAEDLKMECAKRGLVYCDSYDVKSVSDQLMRYYREESVGLTKDDWTILDLYRAYVFRKDVVVVPADAPQQQTKDPIP